MTVVVLNINFAKKERPVKIACLYSRSGCIMIFLLVSTPTGARIEAVIKTEDGSHNMSSTGTFESMEEAERELNLIIDQGRQVPELEVINIQEVLFPANCNNELFLDIIKARSDLVDVL